ncbi:MAG: 4Fe-4S dicluster domain-containing protein [Caldilinea sp.]|jgi:formate dehydrogenase iron-sulfur subunit|uniref:4Fe-4S dicluster domain-containing protein n=1 Tax=Caldilinea sp. TaxID=2293560 RepID=UPI0030A42A98
MALYAFLLDLSRCIGCEACAAACIAGNELPAGAQYIHLIEQTHGVFPHLTGGFKNHRCYHCADAACVKVCPTGALYKEDGLTRLNRDVCIGCAYCTDACPFDVPQIVDGRSSKCDACAATTKAGGQPWCVRTCPSDALRYGERREILAEAHARVEAIRARYPKARVYGEAEAGGLGVVVVLPDAPEAFDLPANPQTPLLLDVWQKVVQPAAVGLTGLSVLVTGVAAIIARRNHMKELAELRAQQAQTEQNAGAQEGER